MGNSEAKNWNNNDLYFFNNLLIKKSLEQGQSSFAK